MTESRLFADMYGRTAGGVPTETPGFSCIAADAGYERGLENEAAPEPTEVDPDAA